MGKVTATVELVNTTDEMNVWNGLVKEGNVRRMTADLLVDTGAVMLCINETAKEQLGLRVISKDTAELANGQVLTLDVVGPVTVYFKNRQTMCRAFVLPGDTEMLLGAIPMEDMDVVIVPKRQTIDVNPLHPNVAQKSLK